MTTDDRVTLPLSAVRAAADWLCGYLCDDSWTGKLQSSDHHPDCLNPLLAERDLLMVTTFLATAISGDCLDPTKHGSCGGCACHCHTLKTGRMKK